MLFFVYILPKSTLRIIGSPILFYIGLILLFLSTHSIEVLLFYTLAYFITYQQMKLTHRFLSNKNLQVCESHRDSLTEMFRCLKRQTNGDILAHNGKEVVEIPKNIIQAICPAKFLNNK